MTLGRLIQGILPYSTFGFLHPRYEEDENYRKCSISIKTNRRQDFGGAEIEMFRGFVPDPGIIERLRTKESVSALIYLALHHVEGFKTLSDNEKGSSQDI